MFASQPCLLNSSAESCPPLPLTDGGGDDDDGSYGDDDDDVSDGDHGDVRV